MTKWKPRLAAGAFLCACLLLGDASQAQLPTLGDPSDMNSSTERKLGERIARELYRDTDYLDDPVLDEYVLGIWARLLAAARVRGELTAELDDRFAWQVLLGKDRVINAFALPGGWLGLQLGLVNVTASRDELASVLAHELSHVTQRHISRLMTQQSRQAPWVLGAMILGALVASKSPEAANALITGGQALGVQNQLNFSRDMEREADRVGFGVSTQAGFEAQGFVAMFDKLQQAARLNDNGSFPYLRTHPMTTERIADMQARQQMARGGNPPPPDLVHAMMVGRSRVLSSTSIDTLRSSVAEAEGLAATAPRTRQATALYAAALASAKLRDGAAAAKFAGKLADLAAGEPPAARLANLLMAEVALQAGDTGRAASLGDASAGARPELLLAAQAWIRTGRAAQASQRLQTWVALHPRDAQAWQLLAAASAAQGQTLRSIRAEAEAQVAHLDYQAALDRFKAAQDLVRKGRAGAGDHIEASIIDTRARQMESLIREEALERRLD